MLSCSVICAGWESHQHTQEITAILLLAGWFSRGVAGYQIALDLSLGLHDILDSALSFDPSA
jgi:hypothetical protein